MLFFKEILTFKSWMAGSIRNLIEYAKSRYIICLCRKRETYLQKGKALLKEGRKSEANDCFQRCIDVSPEMALALIKVSTLSDSAPGPR